ncbi:hypothetical protein Csa_018516, partial [Cucumis sativus]
VSNMAKLTTLNRSQPRANPRSHQPR